MGKGIESRLKQLENRYAMTDDAYLLEWGQTVTDDELSAVAAMPLNLDAHRNNRGRAQQASTMTDTQLYRIIKPAIDALRRNGSGHEQA